MMIRASLFAAAITVLVACTSKVAEPVAAPTPGVPKPTVIDPQLKALQDAKAVQATLDAAERKRRKDLADADG